MFGLIVKICYNGGMKYQISQNKITLEASQDFDIYDICHCGQLFRYFESDSHTSIVAGKEQADILPINQGGEVEIVCTNAQFFANYFDLENDYSAIKSKLKGNEFLDKAIKFGGGIRILRQNFFETFLSFIVSQNNNIKRIQKTLNSLSQDLGQKIGEYYAFPTLENLKNADEKYFESIGAGYRAKYLTNFVASFDEELENQVQALSTPLAREKLICFLGVGNKVADCILLFGLTRKDVFPVDTWIDKVAREFFGISGTRENMSKTLVQKFGELSGYAQQYLFYYKRELDSLKKGD